MNTAIAGEKTSGALPPLVRQFVERNAPTAPAPSRIRLRQKGSMQLKPGRWRAFTAEQEMSVERVKFSWRVPLITVDVHDWYRAAEGGLEVRVLGLPLGRMRGGTSRRAKPCATWPSFPGCRRRWSRTTNSSGARSTTGLSRSPRACRRRA